MSLAKADVRPLMRTIQYPDSLEDLRDKYVKCGKGGGLKTKRDERDGTHLLFLWVCGKEAGV